VAGRTKATTNPWLARNSDITDCAAVVA